MKPAFALSLSFEGITLLHRADDGWRTVGDVPIDAQDLPDALSDLRAKAAMLESGPLRCKVILPNEQIKYLTVETGALQGEARRGMIEAELATATPYALSDLVYDLSVEGSATHVAAVAQETLAEAESFAVEHGFHPVSYAAAPEPGTFLGEAYFGMSEHAATLDDVGHVVSDGDPVISVGAAIMPPLDSDPEFSDPAQDIETADTPTPAPEPKPAVPEPAPAMPGFSSRRTRSGNGAPSLAGAQRDPQSDSPAKAAPDPKPQPVISVTAPTLDLPPDVPAAPSGFSSRRKPAPNVQAEMPPAVPEDLAFKAPLQTTPEPQSETERMTVFGARESQRIGGKPKFLGLMLTAVLLLFLVAVAAWASIFLDDGLSGLFGRDDPAIAQTQGDVSEPAQPQSPDTVQASLPNADAPIAPSAVSPDTTASAPTEAEEPAEELASLPGLSDTDAAVLDVLRAEPDLTTDTDPTTDAPVDLTDEAKYAATGIWPVAPDVPDAPFLIDLDDVYLASIDRTDLSQDAVALPSAEALATDTLLDTVTSPASAGTAAVLADDGLVEPTPEGALTPDGVIVYLGRPAIVPPPTPARLESAQEIESQRQEYLAALRPRPRPVDLVESNERANLGGKSLDELAKLRPRLRPKTAKQIAEEDETPTAQAVVVSRLPKSRPRNFASIVEKAKPKPAPAAAPASTPAPSGSTGSSTTASLDSTNDQGSTRTGRTGGTSVKGGSVKPAAPTPASVARQATLQNAINMQRLNLIGVYGTPSNRRALIRLPSGRYKKVQVGDLVDGGKVVAIGESELRYQKGGRNMTLKIPSG